MANQQKSIESLPGANAFSNAATDSVVCVVNGNTSLVSVSVLQQVNTALGTPTNGTSTTVAAGTCWTDGAYLYLATSANVVKRVALSSF